MGFVLLLLVMIACCIACTFFVNVCAVYDWFGLRVAVCDVCLCFCVACVFVFFSVYFNVFFCFLLRCLM